MENSARKKVYEINKANGLNRFGAFLIDIILLITLMAGILFLESKIFKYDEAADKLNDYYVQYGVYIPDSENQGYYITCDEDTNIDSTACELSKHNFMNDQEALLQRRKVNNLIIVFTTTSSLLAVLIIEFLIPLCTKHRKTPGYFCLRIGLIGKDGVKPKPVQLFARAVIGRWALEIMPLCFFLLFWISGMNWIPIGLLLVLLIFAQFTIHFNSKNRIYLHDLVSNTVPCDDASQFYANSLEELNQKTLGK